MQGIRGQQARIWSFRALQCGILCLASQANVLLALDFSIPLASLANHNTSAYSAYNQANFAANFGTTSWVSQSGATMTVDPSKVDESLNPAGLTSAGSLTQLRGSVHRHTSTSA
jgi:hypothetical protein